MGDRHRRVLLEQQQRHRLADDVAAADDNRALAGEHDTVATQQLHAAGRCVRKQAGLALSQQPSAHRVNAIDILARVELSDCASRHKPGWQRQLDQNAADRMIVT
jgi:hypothetical protein